MWQRFTQRARRVIFFAQEEAGKLGENYVSTEHMMLGLIRESDCVAGRMLDRMGISLSRIREEIERQVTPGEGRLGQDMQLTPRAKSVIDLAYDEARQLNNNYIGTEHLLLGLIREGEGMAGRVLAHLGVDLDLSRAQLKRIQQESGENSTTSPEDSPGDDRRKRMADLEAARQKLQEAGFDAPQVDAVTLQFGDLGVVQAKKGQTHIEVALDTASFVRLSDIYRAKDAHGYRQMSHGDQTMFLLPNGTPLKFLVCPPDSKAATSVGGIYVRVLGGDYTGYAGWIFAPGFSRTGTDDAPFPPPENER